MKVYLDTCCYNRLFDDRSNIRNYLERESVLLIFEEVYAGLVEIVGSDIVDEELLKIKDKLRGYKTLRLYMRIIAMKSIIDDSIEELAENIRKRSYIKHFDSMHLSVAMKEANYLITTDDKFLKNGNKLNNIIRIVNPIEFMTEVLHRNE